jgi:hypothetical protein
MVRTHKVVEEGEAVHVLFYVDGVQVGASVFLGDDHVQVTKRHDFDEYVLACQLGQAWDCIGENKYGK